MASLHDPVTLTEVLFMSVRSGNHHELIYNALSCSSLWNIVVKHETLSDRSSSNLFNTVSLYHTVSRAGKHYFTASYESVLILTIHYPSQCEWINILEFNPQFSSFLLFSEHWQLTTQRFFSATFCTILCLNKFNLMIILSRKTSHRRKLVP